MLSGAVGGDGSGISKDQPLHNNTIKVMLILGIYNYPSVFWAE
jgi:hypothetical protein